MEKLRINEKLYELVANGLQLTDQGGEVIFRPGSATFDTVLADVRSTKSITVLDDLGDPILTRADLVYAGKLAKYDNSPTGVENAQETVMIATFRAPDVREKLAELEARQEYMAMMAGIEMEV